MTSRAERMAWEGGIEPTSGVVVVGGANIDCKARSDVEVVPQTSNPGQSSMSPGGVGRNIAENIARLGDDVELISVVGRDALGHDLLAHAAAAGIGVQHVVRTDRPTGTYTAVLDNQGELVVAISDMEGLTGLGREQIRAVSDVIAGARIVVLDGNLELDALDEALEHSAGALTIFEPVSVPKATRLRDAVDDRVWAVTPNVDELAALTGMPTDTDGDLREATRSLHGRGVEVVWVRLGPNGSVVSTSDQMVQIPAVPVTVEDVTGAGDSMLGAFCHALLGGSTVQEAARLGHAAASLTIASHHTVRPDLSVSLLAAVLDQALPEP